MKKKSLKPELKIELNYYFCILIKLLIIILLPFSGFITMNAQWMPRNNGLIGNTVWCFIIDGNNTYTSTEVGGIFITTDNGDNWTAKNKGLKSFFGLNVLSLAISGNNIFAGTMGDGIFLSKDKGENWVRKSNGLPYGVKNGIDTIYKEMIYVIKIFGNNILAGTNKGIYISTDNGDKWILKNNGLPKFDTLRRHINAIALSGNNNIFSGTRYGVYMSTDNGDNWSAKNKGIENLTVYTLAIKGNNIYAGTEYGGIFLSTDNGDNWKNIGLKDTIIAAIIINGNYILAGGGFYISSNNGNDWTTYLYDIGVLTIIINGDYVFAGTASHGVLRAKLSDLGITDVKEPEQRNEFKIYPNPASDEFRLRFHTPIETTVQLSVFDLLGNCVLSHIEPAAEGTNEKNINCEKLPQGYYYVKININEVVETVPLVIVK